MADDSPLITQSAVGSYNAQASGGSTAVVNVYQAAADVVVSMLHQLPPPPPDFTGRDVELTALLAQFDQGVSHFALRGQGGVGKTALALKLAMESLGRYPDAQIFLDVKGISDAPLTAVDIMSHVVHSFQPAANLPENEAELMATYRSVLFGKRVLLLIDDVSEVEQITPMLPVPAGCGIIITSRLHFHVAGLYAHDLALLSVVEACALLLKIAPRIGKEVEHIAQLCGYLPLALTVIAGGIAARSDLNVANYAQRLEAENALLDIVSASFTLSYKLLSKKLRETWRFLAIFPATFNLVGAVRVCQIEGHNMQQRLSELVRYSLVEWDELTQRYSLHVLARSFAYSKLSAAERAVAHRRHAVFYKDVLIVAEHDYCMGVEYLTRGLMLLETELVNIRAGHDWATKWHALDNTAMQLCIDYVGYGQNCLSLWLHPSEWKRWLESALIAAQQLNNRKDEETILGNLGSAYFKLGDVRRALEFYEQALAIACEVGDRHGEGTWLGNLGNTYSALDEPQRAVETYVRALTIAREIGDRRVEGSILINISSIHMRLGETRKALEEHELAWAIAIETGDLRGAATQLGNLAVMFAILNEPEKEIKLLEQALTVALEIGDLQMVGILAGNLGAVCAALRMPREAIQFYQKGVAIARQMGNRGEEAMRLHQMGRAHYQLKEYEEAVLLAETASKIYEAIEDPDVEGVRQELLEWRVALQRQQQRRKWQFWRR